MDVSMSFEPGGEWVPVGQLEGPVGWASRAGGPPPADRGHSVSPVVELEPWFPADRCESCGIPLQLLDVFALVRHVAGAPQPADHVQRRPEWMETRTRHTSDRVAARWSLDMRPHTPERCRRVRAGDPEPWADPADDDDPD